MACFEGKPDPEKLAGFFGPGAVNQQLLQVIQTCWLLMPPEKQTLDHVEQEIRRLVDRAFRDMREDEKRRSEG